MRRQKESLYRSKRHSIRMGSTPHGKTVNGEQGGEMQLRYCCSKTFLYTHPDRDNMLYTFPTMDRFQTRFVRSFAASCNTLNPVDESRSISLVKQEDNWSK